MGPVGEPDRRSPGWRELLALVAVGAVAMTIGVVIGVVATRGGDDTVRARADDTATESALRDQLEDAARRTADAEAALEEAEERAEAAEATLAARSSTTISDSVLAAVRDELEAELADRTATLDEREAELTARATGLDERAAELEERASELDDREADLDAREAEIGTPTTSIPRSSFGDGVHRVGVDIRSGTYRGNTQGDTCYWARLAALDGEASSVIASDVAEGTVTLAVAPTDAGFETTGCGLWTRIG